MAGMARLNRFQDCQQRDESVRRDDLIAAIGYLGYAAAAAPADHPDRATYQADHAIALALAARPECPEANG